MSQSSHALPRPVRPVRKALAEQLAADHGIPVPPAGGCAGSVAYIGDIATTPAVPPVRIDPDFLTPTRLELRSWTALADDIRFVEMLAEDTETRARVRVDLSTAQATALRDHLGRLLDLADPAGQAA